MATRELSEQEQAEAVCNILAGRLRLAVVIPGSGLEWEEDVEYEETPNGLRMKTGMVMEHACSVPHSCDRAYVRILQGPAKYVGQTFTLELRLYGDMALRLGDRLDLMLQVNYVQR